MKILASILIFGLFLISCSKSENVNELVKQPSATPILEISSELVGIWDVQGEILDFRLYNFGIAEYEELDQSKFQPGINKTDDLKVKKQIKVSDEEIEEILDLLESVEFLNLRDRYIARKGCTDTSVYQTIRFQFAEKQKRIKIYGSCEEPNAENFPDFPPILAKLSERAGEIRSKAAKTK
jgi:hypothetical protein